MYSFSSGYRIMNLKQFKRRYNSEQACIKVLEQIRWPEGPVCTRCGAFDRAGRIKTRPRVLNCLECYGQFTVTLGTQLERSHIPLKTWFLATYLIMTLPEQIIINDFSKLLGLPYKTTWHLLYRLRIMLKDESTLLYKLIKVLEIPALAEPPMLNVEVKRRPRRKK